MRTQNEIEKLADEAMDGLNNLQQVEANSFLFGKIQNRMQLQRQQQQQATVKTLSTLSIALVLFICLNIASYHYLSGNSRKQQTTQQTTTAAQAFAAEYHLTTAAYNY